jgi:acyl carrier protein
MSIQRLVENIVGTSIAIAQPFSESGLDSLGAIELRDAIAQTFGVKDLPATLVFDYPTIEALAGFLASKQQPMSSKEGLATSLISNTVTKTIPLNDQLPWISSSSSIIGMSCQFPAHVKGII